MNKISQRDDRQYRADLNALKQAIRNDRCTYEHSPIGARFLLKVVADKEVQATIRTARRLQHRVVVYLSDDGVMVLYGLPLPSEEVKP